MAKTRQSSKKTQQKRRRVRLLPLTITMLSLLFIIKVNELYLGSKQLREMYGAHDAVAEDKKPADDAKADGKDKPADAKAEPAKEGDKAASRDTKKDDAKPAEGDAKPADAKAEPAKEGDKAASGDGKKDGKKDGAKPPEEEKTYGTGKTTVKEIEAMKARDAQPRYTQTELDLLQNLSKRRDELDQREKDLDIKEKVLDASEKRISDKIMEMKTLQSELSKVLAQYNEKQDTQIKSLVKIYESMKPEEAAAIFNEMEMPILLDVIGKMSERKVALVLAGMSPKKAKDVTQELADKRKKAAQNAAAVTEAASPAAPPAKP